MADVTQTGSVFAGNFAANSNLAVTVPADADYCLVYAVNYSGDGRTTGNIDHLAFGASGGSPVLRFDHLGDGLYNVDEPEMSAYGMSAASPYWPGSGSKNLYFELPGYTEGLIISVSFWKNVDRANPIVDVFGTGSNAGGDSERSFGALDGMSAADMAVLGVDNFTVASLDMSPGMRDQEVLYVSPSAYNDVVHGLAYKLGASLMYSGTGTATFTSGILVGLRASTDDGTVELDGEISSESTVEGSLQLAVGLQGGLTSVSTVQGSLGLAMPLEGTISSVSRLSGDLGIPTVLQGTIASASGAAGTLGLVQGLTGTIRSESELTGELDSGGAIALTGTISSTSQVQGQFALVTALTGSIASASSLTGDLAVAGDMSLVGTASSVSAMQGRLGLATELTGIAKSTSQAVGGLGLNLLLSSEVRSVSEVHGSLGPSIPLSGTISSESVLSGELSVAGANALAGAISSVSALHGELNLSIGLAGSSRSESSLSSELTFDGELALGGEISSASQLSGVLSIGPYIDLQESITLGAYDTVRVYSRGDRLFTL